MVSNFVVQALRGEPITIYGDGQQTRAFCYVDDLVTGLMALMALEDVPGPVNLGNPGEFTIRQLAELVLELAGSSSELLPTAAARGRSHPSPARHQPRPRAPVLGAPGRPARRPHPHH